MFSSTKGFGGLNHSGHGPPFLSCRLSRSLFSVWGFSRFGSRGGQSSTSARLVSQHGAWSSLPFPICTFPSLGSSSVAWPDSWGSIAVVTDSTQSDWVDLPLPHAGCHVPNRSTAHLSRPIAPAAGLVLRKSMRIISSRCRLRHQPPNKSFQRTKPPASRALWPLNSNTFCGLLVSLISGETPHRRRSNSGLRGKK